MIVLVFVKGPGCWFGQDQPPGPVKITQLAPFHFLGRDHCPTFNSKDVSWQDTFNFLIKNAATYAAGACWLVRSLVLEEEFRTLRNENCYQLCLCTHNHNSHQHHQHWHPDIMKAVVCKTVLDHLWVQHCQSCLPAQQCVSGQLCPPPCHPVPMGCL